MTRIPISIFVSLSFTCECVRLPDNRPIRSMKSSSDHSRRYGRNGKRPLASQRFTFPD